jgi:hypothetical protein
MDDMSNESLGDSSLSQGKHKGRRRRSETPGSDSSFEDDGQFDVTVDKDDLSGIGNSRTVHIAVNSKYAKG